MVNNIKYLYGDLFDLVKDYESVVIPHVCNNKGAWGAGFVLPLAKKYPITRQEYLNWYNSTYSNEIIPDTPPEVIIEGDNLDLGEIQFIKVEPKIYVCNMVAQTRGGERPLYYNHLCKCMDELANVMERCVSPSLTHILCPQFGAGLAGGDWNIIKQLINDCWIRAGLNVTIVKYKS